MGGIWSRRRCCAGDFLLRSGARSSYYIDKYLFTTRPDLLGRIAGELAELLPDGVQRLAGPVLGAVPLVTALSLRTGLPTLIVRVEKPKEYGTGKQIEGVLAPGERVVIVEDVVTTGGAALAAVDVLREAGLDVLGALAVVDREQGGAEAFLAAACRTGRSLRSRRSACRRADTPAARYRSSHGDREYLANFDVIAVGDPVGGQQRLDVDPELAGDPPGRIAASNGVRSRPRVRRHIRWAGGNR